MSLLDCVTPSHVSIFDTDVMSADVLSLTVPSCYLTFDAAMTCDDISSVLLLSQYYHQGGLTSRTTIKKHFLFVDSCFRQTLNYKRSKRSFEKF